MTLTKRSLPILYLTSTPGFTREYEVGPPKINQPAMLAEAYASASIAGCLIFGGSTSYSLVNPGVEVRYKIGNERLVKVTQNAAAKLAQLLERQGRPTGALRVAVIGGGCSGLQYKMDLVDGPVNRDILVESNQVRVVVDPKSALFVSGSLVDFSDDLQKGGFKVTNPNAVAHCSCGESFSA